MLPRNGKLKMNIFKNIELSPNTNYEFHDLCRLKSEWFPFYIKIIGARYMECDFKKIFLRLIDSFANIIGLKLEIDEYSLSELT